MSKIKFSSVSVGSGTTATKTPPMRCAEAPPPSLSSGIWACPGRSLSRIPGRRWRFWRPAAAAAPPKGCGLSALPAPTAKPPRRTFFAGCCKAPGNGSAASAPTALPGAAMCGPIPIPLLRRWSCTARCGKWRRTALPPWSWRSPPRRWRSGGQRGLPFTAPCSPIFPGTIWITMGIWSATLPPRPGCSPSAGRRSSTPAIPTAVGCWSSLPFRLSRIICRGSTAAGREWGRCPGGDSALPSLLPVRCSCWMRWPRPKPPWRWALPPRRSPPPCRAVRRSAGGRSYCTAGAAA